LLNVSAKIFLKLQHRSQDGANQPNLPESGLDPNLMLIGLLWVAIAAFLFLMRPTTLRGLGERKDPNRRGGGDPPQDDSRPPPEIF
jgi:hypothetical protein